MEKKDPHILVLGAGLVGKAMSVDLKKSGYRVTAADLNEEALHVLADQYGIAARQIDIGTEQLEQEVQKADLVVGALPGALGYGVMERVIRAERNMVDISFCPEDFMALDPLAREHGVTVVPDMGVAPGMCNALLGYHHARVQVHLYRCLVGGLPFERNWPLEYKSSWSPMDCIEEYTRPARFRVGGQEVTRPALSDLEPVLIEPAGLLEAWNSDGLRSLLRSFPGIPNMVEKTLRYPGTVEYLKVLRELGFFSTGPVEVNGRQIRPVDLTAALLFPQFRLAQGEGEFTIMRVNIEGEEGGQKSGYQYDLYDTYDPGTDTTSMARTTGYTCTGVARMILRGMVDGPGVVPPEKVAEKEENYRFLLDHLSERGIEYKLNTSAL
ncbi:MAG: saccharopine dehydrogenase C-terminal domain-containing protein [Bacteroidales bacterium]